MSDKKVQKEKVPVDIFANLDSGEEVVIEDSFTESYTKKEKQRATPEKKSGTGCKKRVKSKSSNVEASPESENISKEEADKELDNTPLESESRSRSKNRCRRSSSNK